MIRRHHPWNQTPDSGTPLGSFDEGSTLGITPEHSPLSVSFSPQQHSYRFRTPSPPALVLTMEGGFLRPPTPFEVGITKGENPPQRKVIV